MSLRYSGYHRLHWCSGLVSFFTCPGAPWPLGGPWAGTCHCGRRGSHTPCRGGTRLRWRPHPPGSARGWTWTPCGDAVVERVPCRTRLRVKKRHRCIIHNEKIRHRKSIWIIIDVFFRGLFPYILSNRSNGARHESLRMSDMGQGNHACLKNDHIGFILIGLMESSHSKKNKTLLSPAKTHDLFRLQQIWRHSATTSDGSKWPKTNAWAHIYTF